MAYLADTFSFKEIDTQLKLRKGTAFQLFKSHLPELTEGIDYVYLDGFSHADEVECLKLSHRVYDATIHATLITQLGIGKLLDAEDVHCLKKRMHALIS